MDTRISEKELRAFMERAYEKEGFEQEEARRIADVLMQADLFGIESHGAQRMMYYHQNIKSGSVDVRARAEIVRETPVSALLDGHFAMGHLTAAKAMNIAIEKAKKTGIGMVVDQNASIAGAAGGCQAECGTAAGMAAAALVELAGGTPAMIGNGTALAIKNLMGLVCDPVAGLVEVPCVKRNGFATVVAMTAADMTMAGIRSFIPVDEVIAAMNEVGHLLPKSLRETSEAGLAVTPTAKAIEKRVYPD